MSTPPQSREWLPAVPARNQRHIVSGLLGLAALAVAAQFAATLLTNAPMAGAAGWALGEPGFGVAHGPLAAVAVGMAALGALAIAGTDDDALAGTGLLFVGVFGLLALVSRAAATPAAAALAGGVGCVALARGAALSPSRSVATVALLGALSLALGSGVGGVSSLRPLASTVTLLGLAVMPAFAGADLEALLGGALAFALIVAAGLSMPFVTGAVTLVSGGVVGASLPVVALGVAGAVTAASAAVRTGRWRLLAGLALVALAGVPAAIPRAVPFALGTAVLASPEVSQ